MNPAPQPAAVVAALKETTDRLAELIEGEQDDPSVGIVGWNGLHQLVASNRTLLSTPAAAPAVAPAANANQLFEEKAEWFYRATGMLAPGKDDRSGAFSYEERKEAWDRWNARQPDGGDGEDKERLDWLEANSGNLPHSFHVAIINRVPYRQAIDAAKRKESPTK